MTAIVNPGSHIGEPGKGWTNTYVQARAYADEWLANIRSDGFIDIEMFPESEEEDLGRWTFTFRHTVTRVEVKFTTHGIDNIDVYEKWYLFTPRVFWNGSSSATPELKDFFADGFTMTKTYVAVKP